MILLRLISWPYVRKHGLRSLLTMLGIAMGVAVYVSMHLANEAVLGSFAETVNRIAGRTQLQITAGEPGFDETVLERVQALTDVKVAVPIIEAVVGTGLEGQGSLLILGVDMTGDRSLRDYALEAGEDAVVDDPLVFLAQPDSIIVTSQFASRNGLRPGDRLPLDTAQGIKPFTVRGILTSSGLTSAFGGNLAIMDVYAAQFVFGRGRKVDRIDLSAADGVRVDDLQAQLQRTLGAGFEIEPPSSRGRSLESLSRIYSFMLKFSSAFALVIGMFVIYNAFGIAVAQRRKEIGILRALGATRRQIAGLFLGESALIGVLGSAVGLMIGTWLARLIAAGLGGLLEGVYGRPQTADPPALDSTFVLLAMALGVGASILAAAVPARAAAHVDPVKALQKGTIQQISARESRARWIAAAVLVPASLVVLAASSDLTGLYVAYALTMLAALLLTPQLSVWTARALRPLLQRVWPVEGTLAADSVIGAPRRTSATVAALMASIALVIGLAGSSSSAYRNIADWVTTALNPDLFVSTSPTMVAHDYHLPASLQGDIASVPGVDEVQTTRVARIRLGGDLISVIVVEMGPHVRRTPRHALEGDVAEMFRLAAAGQGAIVSENLSALRDLHQGDTIELPTPRGLLRLPVVGVIREYSDQQGSVFLDRQVFHEWWQDDAVDIFRVYLDAGANAEEVKTAILSRVGANRRLFVLLNADVRQYVMNLADQWFGMTWVQIAVAILVAVLGIVNSLTVSIVDRRRELGILRAVGGLRGQVRRTIWIEAITIGTVGVILGLALGTVQLYYQIAIGARDYPGMQLSYLYPAAIALLSLPLIAGVSWLASLGPAEAAVRGSLVEALEYE
jgi:putative ABC transport system permease protein